MNLFKRSPGGRDRTGSATGSYSNSMSSSASPFASMARTSGGGNASAGLDGTSTPDDGSSLSFSLTNLTATLKRTMGKGNSRDQPDYPMDSSRRVTEWSPAPSSGGTTTSGATLSRTAAAEEAEKFETRINPREMVILRYMALGDTSCASLETLSRTITVLDLSYNAFTQIPDAIVHLQTLRRLYVCHNQLQRINPQFSTMRLTHLALSDNQLTTASLQVADLGNHDGHVAPLARTLCHLWVDGNRIADIGTLLYNFDALRTLSLARNQLTAIAPDALPTTLQFVSLSGNNLASIPAALLSIQSLRGVMISGNSPSFVEAGFRCISALRNQCRAIEIPSSASQQTRLSIALGDARVSRIGKRSIAPAAAAAPSPGSPVTSSPYTTTAAPAAAIAAPAVSSTPADSGAPARAAGEGLPHSNSTAKLAAPQRPAPQRPVLGPAEPRPTASSNATAPVGRRGAPTTHVISVLPHIKFDTVKPEMPGSLTAYSLNNYLSESSSSLAAADSTLSGAGSSNAPSGAQNRASILSNRTSVHQFEGSTHSLPGAGGGAPAAGPQAPDAASTQSILKARRAAQLKLDQSMSELRSMIELAAEPSPAADGEAPQPPMPDLSKLQKLEQLELEIQNGKYSGSLSELAPTPFHRQSMVQVTARKPSISQPVGKLDALGRPVQPGASSPTSCARCHRPIDDLSCVLALDTYFHPGCFTCEICHTLLTTDYFELPPNHVYCEQHLYEARNYRCESCRGLIEGGYVELQVSAAHSRASAGDSLVTGATRSGYWHPRCFQCINCHKDCTQESTMFQILPGTTPSSDCDIWCNDCLQYNRGG